jgi:hypothetical protein
MDDGAHASKSSCTAPQLQRSRYTAQPIMVTVMRMAHTLHSGGTAGVERCAAAGALSELASQLDRPTHLGETIRDRYSLCTHAHASPASASGHGRAREGS